jgi:oxygen-independent coproporphyrinogen-3 oxidase
MTLSPAQLQQAASAKPQGLYLHIPFCARRCRYCDFNSNLYRPDLADAFVAGVLAELAFWSQRLDLSAIRTIFLGGGTPTVLPADHLDRLIRSLLAGCSSPIEEFTIEANPATIDPPLARHLHALGVNRISLGAQSFDPAELKLLGRLHSADQVRQSVAAVREAGFDNVNLDLMFGLPAQTLAGWRSNMAAAVALGIEHLSCYALSIEPHTPMGEDLSAGRILPPDEYLVADMYRAAQHDLAAAGFEHYEISNWARPAASASDEISQPSEGRLPAFHCRHNVLYWDNRPWLAIGPSAASFLGGIRFKAVGDLATYIAAAAAGRSDYTDIEQLTGLRAIGEAIMLALRLRRGLDADEFQTRYGVDVARQFAEPIARHTQAGLLRWVGRRLQLTEQSLPVADSVLADFIAV